MVAPKVLCCINPKFYYFQIFYDPSFIVKAILGEQPERDFFMNVFCFFLTNI